MTVTSHQTVVKVRLRTVRIQIGDAAYPLWPARTVEVNDNDDNYRQ
jgi:hypothetical protein